VSGAAPVGEQWRVVVTFQYADDAEKALRCLHDAGEVRTAGGTISYSETTISVYTPGVEATKPIALAVRNGLAEAGIKPLRVDADRWLPLESRWSSDRRSRPGWDLDGLDIVDFILESLPWSA